jgi:glutathione S-transferase
MITLYDHVLSGCCYKARLLMSLLGVAYEKVAIDAYPGQQHRRPDFLAFSRFGRLPVLDDGAVRLADPQAILVYLAAKHDGRWYPQQADAMGEVGVWLGFAATELMHAAAAREHELLGIPGDIAAARVGAYRAFRLLDDHLAERELDGREWLALDHATIADIACFPYVALAADGNLSLDDFHAVRRWLARVKWLPGFADMPGILAFH